MKVKEDLNKKYKIGVLLTRRQENEGRTVSVAICNCGTSSLPDRNGYHPNKYVCQGCGNKEFIQQYSVGNSWQSRKYDSNFKKSIPKLIVLHKDSKSFKVKRVNVGIELKDRVLRVTGEGRVEYTLEFNLIDKYIKLYNKDELIVEVDSEKEYTHGQLEQMNSLFMRGITAEDFIKLVSYDENIHTLHKSLLTFYGGGNSYSKTKKRPITAFYHYMKEDLTWVQVLVTSGLNFASEFVRQVKYKRGLGTINTKATKPHEIIGVSKSLLREISNQGLTYSQVLEISNFCKKDKSLENKVLDVLSIVKDESNLADFANSLDVINSLTTDYGYSNLRKLVLYAFRECKHTQGIDRGRESLTLLRDYLRMSRAIGLDISGCEKYPKSLKKIHDLANLNYKSINVGNENIPLFKAIVESPSYKSLNYEDKKEDYCVVSPKTPSDIVREGNELSHCVGSYVKDVIAEKCKILFLRLKDDVDTPLATIEVRGRNIRQAKGVRNRPLTSIEKEFISKWSKENNLQESYY